MKQVLLTGFWILFNQAVFAQNMAVQLDKMNVLFVGIPNEMHIVVNDVAPERLILLPSMGEVDTTDLKSGYYNWEICKKDTSVAWLVLADSVSTNPIDTVFFRVKRMPEPRFRLVHPKGHHSQGGIVALYDNPEFHYMADARVIITGFDMCYWSKKSGDPLEKHNAGARFNSEISDLYNRATPGDRYYFYNIQWKTGCDVSGQKSGEVLNFLIK
jgi:hypothetical protein